MPRDFEFVLKGIGVFIDISFNGERLPVEPRECMDSGVPGDCDEGISPGNIRCGVCGGDFSRAGDFSGGSAIAAFLAFLAGAFLTLFGSLAD